MHIQAYMIGHTPFPLMPRIRDQNFCKIAIADGSTGHIVVITPWSTKLAIYNYGIVSFFFLIACVWSTLKERQCGEAIRSADWQTIQERKLDRLYIWIWIPSYCWSPHSVVYAGFEGGGCAQSVRERFWPCPLVNVLTERSKAKMPDGVPFWILFRQRNWDQ